MRCVVLGQDPYPCPAFATGRAFEAGNVADWRELEKMFSTSVRTFMQLIAAARTGEPSYAGSTAGWQRLIDDIEAGAHRPRAGRRRSPTAGSPTACSSSIHRFTLSRFAVDGDPHQLRGHLPLWRPLMVAVLRHLAGRGTPVVFIAFGDQAADALAEAGHRRRGRPTAMSAASSANIRPGPRRCLRWKIPSSPATACSATMGAAPVVLVAARWPRPRPTTTSSSAPARPAASLANRLSADPDRSVLLIEAGGKDRHPLVRLPMLMGKLMHSGIYNWRYQTEPEPELDNRRIYWPRGKALGGTSTINGMIYVRGNRRRLRPLGADGQSRLVLCRGAALFPQVGDPCRARATTFTAATAR